MLDYKPCSIYSAAKPASLTVVAVVLSQKVRSVLTMFLAYPLIEVLN